MITLRALIAFSLQVFDPVNEITVSLSNVSIASKSTLLSSSKNFFDPNALSFVATVHFQVGSSKWSSTSIHLYPNPMARFFPRTVFKDQRYSVSTPTILGYYRSIHA